MRVLAALAFALGLAGCSAAPGVPAPTPDLARAICADPPVDRAYPAAGTGIRIKSHGQAMNGMLYQPAGKGPHPVVVLCHGLPGNEQNLDLAQAVRRAGWAVVTYHYRGSWGSEGSFSIEGTLDDVDAVLAHLRNPETARAWRIDPKRMVVVGHSLGGFDAAHAGAHAADVIGTALLAPWDPSLDAAQLSTLDRAARDQVGRHRQ